MWGHKTLKILIIEDDINNHPLYRDAFEGAGFVVKLSQTADGDFIDKVLEFSPNIISMDLMLGMEGEIVSRDGFQALELLKADVQTKKIPVMILTNFSEERKVLLAKKLGAVDFISIQGQPIKKIPEIFKNYLKSPRGYKPEHSIFRKD